MPHNFSDEQNGRPLHSHCCYFQIWCGPVVTVPLIPPIRVQSNGAHHGNPVIWKTFGSTSTVQEPTTFYPEDTTGPLSLSLSATPVNYCFTPTTETFQPSGKSGSIRPDRTAQRPCSPVSRAQLKRRRLG